MSVQNRQMPVWSIWALVVAFAVIEAAAWTVAGGVPRRPLVLVQVIAAWVVMLILAALATRRIGSMAGRIREHEHTHRVSLAEIEQLQTQNAILQIVAKSVDAPLAFQALAARIARIVPCDRVGLALLDESGTEFETYTARVQEEERRARARPELMFRVEGTVLGAVTRSQEPMIVPDIGRTAGEYLDTNVLHTSGFGSILVVPMISKGRSVGTLNLVARAKNAFTTDHAATIQPIAEIFAVAVVAQQLQMKLGRYRTMEAMSELTLSVSSEINGALQTIIGHCGLLERGYPNPALHRDLDTIVRQSQRISELLGRMRSAASERLREAEAAVSDAGIPSSPEAFGDSTLIE
jgi:transcriptional regulator with GAF, ATPase, and Fis domain